MLGIVVASVVEAGTKYSRNIGFNGLGEYSFELTVLYIVSETVQKVGTAILGVLVAEGQKHKGGIAPWSDKLTVIATLYSVFNLTQGVLENLDVTRYI